MANPFGYGDALGFSRDQIGESGLIPTQWLNEGFSLALPSVYFPQVTPYMSQLEKMEGDSIVVPLEGQMTDTSWPVLSEGTSIGVGSFNMDSQAVIIKEAGRGLAIERLARQFLKDGSYPGAMQKFASQLINNFTLSWENQLRGLYLSGNFWIRNVANGSFSGVNSGAPTNGTGTLTTDALDAVLDEFRTTHTGTLGTFVIQPFDDGLYRFVGNWRTIKGLLTDSDWRTLQTNTEGMLGRGLIYQEMGPWNGFMIVMHNLMPDGTCLAHGRNVAVQAFGGKFDDDMPPESYQQLNEPVPFQIRYESDWKHDFHRAKAAAWYALAGSAGALMNTGTSAVRVYSAT